MPPKSNQASTLPVPPMKIIDEFKTSGRVGRGGFWLRQFTLVPLALWLTVAAGETLGAPYDLPFAIGTTMLLVSLWVRRLHDRGHSAWWLAAACIPVLGALVLLFECGLRGAGREASRYGAPPGLRPDYVVVGVNQRLEHRS